VAIVGNGHYGQVKDRSEVSLSQPETTVQHWGKDFLPGERTTGLALCCGWVELLERERERSYSRTLLKASSCKPVLDSKELQRDGSVITFCVFCCVRFVRLALAARNQGIFQPIAPLMLVTGAAAVLNGAVLARRFVLRLLTALSPKAFRAN
jgi:hypothetical protein